MVLILTALPFFFAAIMHRNRDKLHLQAMQDKIGTLYQGIRFANFWERLYASVFLGRRLTYAILTVACINNPNILIHVFLLTNIMYIVYLGLSMPNDSKLARRVEYFNESGL